MKILVTGGAGYIGSHMCKYLNGRGHTPVVIDNLSRGHRPAVQWGPFYEGHVSDTGLLDRVFSDHRIAAVMHFAAFAYVGESVETPAVYYRNNTAETLCLIDYLVRQGLTDIGVIFSSTCAVYGEPQHLPIDEHHPLAPVNPYGRSKLMIEQALQDEQMASGLKVTALRYFNAAGADPDGAIGEDHRPETHLIPIVLQAALGQRDAVYVFGTDYPTEDGTCIRDYIHVDDLAQAHLLALERLLDGQPGGVYNLGTGSGYSVRQVVDLARGITGADVPVREGDRRPGDPAVLVAASDRAVQELGWQPRYSDLEAIIDTAWRWHREHPDGIL